MHITASGLPATQPFTAPTPAGRRVPYALLLLAAFSAVPAAAIAFNVLHNPAHTDAGIYGLASLCYLAAAISQRTLLPARTSTATRVRWNLWVGFLLLSAIGLFLAFLDDKALLHVSPDVRHISISIAYALAYIVTVNPPRSTAWRRLWLVDALIAGVMGITFFLVYHYGEPAGVYTALLFAVAIRVILSLGSMLSLRTADSPESRDLAGYMTVYFILSAVTSGLENLPHVWPRLSVAPLGDLIYACAPAGLALMPLLLYRRRQQPGTLTPPRRLPPAAPVLATCAILFACLPLLHFNVVTGIALLVVAIGLFAVKVALLQTDFEHERTSLLQSNKQLRELAYIDPVTGIANRRKFLEVAGDALQTARRGLEPHWLLLIELENLRSIFASSGRRASELHLCEFVELVRPVLDPATTTHFAHVANGEFAVLLKRANQQTIELTVQQIRDALGASRIHVTTGAALATSSGPDSVERWLANAGTLLHRNRAFELHSQTQL